MRKLKQEDAVARMLEARPDYDYSKFEYKGSSVKSVVVCSKHGDFLTRYDRLVQGHGCPKCKDDLTGARRAISQEEAVRRMIAAKPEFDYSRFEYKGAAVKSVVGCPKHGGFLSPYDSIVGGHGCPKCKSDSVSAKCTYSQEEAIGKMVAISPQYDYTKFIYRGAGKKSTVLCDKHGEFQSSMDLITAGRGCQKCGVESRTAIRTLSQDEAISRMSAEFPQLSFANFVYRKSGTKSEVVCDKHGAFQTTYNAIVTGHGCSKCSFETASVKARIPFAEFVARATAVHGGAFTYSEDSYTGASDTVIANCEKHGKFRIRCQEHISGQGCPDCKDTTFNPKKRAYFYICLVGKGREYTLGYGITKSVRRRKDEHEKRLARENYEIVFLDVFRFALGYYCRDAENKVKAAFPTQSLPVVGFKREATHAENYTELKAMVKDFHEKYGNIRDIVFN